MRGPQSRGLIMQFNTYIKRTLELRIKKKKLGAIMLLPKKNLIHFGNIAVFSPCLLVVFGPREPVLCYVKFSRGTRGL